MYKRQQRNLQETAEGFMLNASIPLDINVSRSSFSTQAMSKPDLAATGIGQGKDVYKRQLTTHHLVSADPTDRKLFKDSTILPFYDKIIICIKTKDDM